MKVTPKMARLTIQYPNVDMQDENRPPNTRRKLFDEEDDDSEDEIGRNTGVEDNITNTFLEETRKSRENAKQRWNFDFEKEEPLPGRYQWVRVDPEGNEISIPVQSTSRAEDGSSMQRETQDNDVAMEEETEERDSEKKESENTIDST